MSLFSQIERADDLEVERWLKNSLMLTTYQEEKLRGHEVVRFSPFYFYKRKPAQKVYFWWRLTLLIYPFYIFILLVFLPLKFIATGKWGYSLKFIDGFHRKWLNKIGI